MARRSVFVIGASGFLGGAIARHQRAAGWTVSGLARSASAAEVLDTHGIHPVEANLESALPSVLEHAEAVDAVVLAAQLDGPTELALIPELVARLQGRTLLFISGSGVLLERTGGSWSEATYAEDDPFPVEPLAQSRRTAEVTVRGAAAGGVRSIVVRPGAVWGPGDHGIVAMTYQSVAATGTAAYIGQGRNTYAEVHVDDVARLVKAALLHGVPGALYHAVGGETPTRWVAEAVARDLGVPARSITSAEAETIWGAFGALIASASARITAPRSRVELGWRPQHHDLLTEVGEARLRSLAKP